MSTLASVAVCCVLQVMSDNPLADFVELPEEYRPLCYSNMLPGIIRGALEMVRGHPGPAVTVLLLLPPGCIRCLPITWSCMRHTCVLHCVVEQAQWQASVRML
jgi:hypothetical protein